MSSSDAPAKAPPRRAPQNICILCDGTWQARLELITQLGVQPTKSLTNVALLAQAISPIADTPDADGHYRRNVVCYISGVGTTLDEFANIFEGGTGAGLDVKVQDAYMFLCDNFQEGDDIFLFGFSRGAYTARCVGGLINWAGVLSKKESLHFTEIWQAYSKRDPADASTDEAAAQLFFDLFGRWPNCEASQVSSAAADAGKAPAPTECQAAIQGLAPHNTVAPPPIRVLGVWDTVGALGVPGHFASAKWTKAWSFYDPGLGSTVQHAFHAIALQEDRSDFLPTFWYQQEGAPAAQVLKQVWFQGAHTDCGGGYGYHGLSDITLAWMVAQMTDAADGPLLHVDLERLRELQDRRVSWARQPAHRSRLEVQFQATRQVGGRPVYSREELDRVVWKSMVETGRRNESIHHSVVVGGRYDPATSPQFADLRATEDGKARLKAMWDEASKVESLLPTERKLMWAEGEHFNADGEEIEKNVAAEVKEQQQKDGGALSRRASKRRSGSGSESGTLGRTFFGTLMHLAMLPPTLLAASINRSTKVPTDNLRPGVLGKGVESLRAKFYRPTSKDTLQQQVLSES